jgi:hypothetical protein
MEPGWTFTRNDYRSFLNFRDRGSCLLHAFDRALQGQFSVIILIHPDGTEERVTREQYEASHRYE